MGIESGGDGPVGGTGGGQGAGRGVVDGTGGLAVDRYRVGEGLQAEDVLGIGQDRGAAGAAGRDSRMNLVQGMQKPSEIASIASDALPIVSASYGPAWADKWVFDKVY